MQVGMPMPQYQCHKKVWAFKIADLEPLAKDDLSGPSGDFLLSPAEVEYLPVTIDAAYMQKHKPEIGGYFVVYDDGYKSYSPAKAFEDGYTRI